MIVCADTNSKITVPAFRVRVIEFRVRVIAFRVRITVFRVFISAETIINEGDLLIVIGKAEQMQKLVRANK